VVFAVCKLKAGKDDGDVGLSSDYFLHACSGLSVHISVLLTFVNSWNCSSNDESQYGCTHS